MPLEEVERRTLWLTVWHSDMFGRNDFLGEVMLPINTIPLDDPQPRWFSLQDRVSYISIPIRNIIYFHFFGTSRHNILDVSSRMNLLFLKYISLFSFSSLGSLLFQTEPLSEELAQNSTSYRGEIIVALKFVPPNAIGSPNKKLGRRNSNSKGTLLILVKEAKNLVSPKGIPDPFSKGYV